jgi:hypothetical protein
LIRGAAALAVAAVAIGCGGQVRFGTPTDTDYDRALGQWTVKGKIFEGIDEQVRYGGTFLSPEFRAAFVKRRAAVFGLDAAGYQALQAEQEAESRKEIDFAFGMYTESPRANDLESSHSIWRVALLGPEGVERTAPIVKRTHPPNADQLAFFPYLDPAWVFYSIRFPTLDAQGKPLFPIHPGSWTLRVASALGTADLTFQLNSQ